MRKSIIIGAAAVGAIFFATNVQAQNNTATTTVKIELADVISIHSGSAAANGTVHFKYLTAEDYVSDQNWNVPHSLIVTSSKSFDVRVKANGADFVDGTNTIPVDVLNIKPVSGGTTTMAGSLQDINLSTADQTIVSGAALGSLLELELDYEIPAAKASTVILGKPTGTYTQTVTYTAVAL